MSDERVTFCRICEAHCGMVATVEDGRMTKLRPDKAHPLSQGAACPKGIAFTDVQNDEDRVLYPLRRSADGTFERVSWQEAMSDIVARLRRVHDVHGGQGIGWYFGNPGGYSYSHISWMAMFQAMLGAKLFTVNSQDANSRVVASRLLYGTPVSLPVPDVARTDFMLMLGANPLVSHGSIMSAPRIKDDLKGVVARGGRVVVVDPRRTETARAFEWQPIVPDSDVWLILSLLHVVFAEGLQDQEFLDRFTSGAEDLARLAAGHPPEDTESRTGIAPDTVRELARTLATTERAVVYGRIGTSVCSAGTLTTILLDALNAVTGNLDAEGGSMFGSLHLPGEAAVGRLLARRTPEHGTTRSRVGSFPLVLSQNPATMMAKEITTPGPGQVRALFISAGNPVVSVPNGDELEQALEDLDLCVSLDIYVTETNAHADYILPCPTMYEREDFPLVFQTLFTTPFRQATPAIVPMPGEVRPEWRIIDDLMRGMAHRTPALRAVDVVRRTMRRFGRELDPSFIVRSVVRLADGGDRFGLRRGGLTLDRLLRDHPSGTIVAEHRRTGMLRSIVLHRDRRMDLFPKGVVGEMRRAAARTADPAFPLRLIGMRELRSENSWMHNAALLVRGGRTHAARMHPDDADALGVEDGAMVSVESPHGAIELPVVHTEDIAPGVVAIPHGWGHRGTGGWRRANAAGGRAAHPEENAGGANVNRLMSTDPQDIEPLAGMAQLTGIPIRVAPLRTRETEVEVAAAAGAGGRAADAAGVAG